MLTKNLRNGDRTGTETTARTKDFLPGKHNQYLFTLTLTKNLKNRNRIDTEENYKNKWFLGRGNTNS